jgi:hypothetical protein
MSLPYAMDLRIRSFGRSYGRPPAHEQTASLVIPRGPL